jgi:hypothetical protein
MSEDHALTRTVEPQKRKRRKTTIPTMKMTKEDTKARAGTLGGRGRGRGRLLRSMWVDNYSFWQ